MLEAVDVSKLYVIENFSFRGKREILTAVDGCSLSIGRGKSVGLVGESGCGKSTNAKMLIGLLKPDSGKILMDGRNIEDLNRRERASKIQLIFQDPFSSLNPRMSVRDVLTEAVKLNRSIGKKDLAGELRRLLDIVGLPGDSLNRFPHQFSGGERQRICIARAIATSPEYIICDEPVSNLDVSIQALVLNLLKDIQKETGVSYLFISHDLATVKYMADEVYVMLDGCIVERAPSSVIFDSPLHNYTRLLLRSVCDPYIVQQPLTPDIIESGRDLNRNAILSEAEKGHWVRST